MADDSIQVASDAVIKASKFVREAVDALKRWNELVIENVDNNPDKYKVFADKAREDLDQAREDLDKARDYHYLKLENLAARQQDVVETVALKRQKVEMLDEPFSEQSALAFDLECYRAGEWIDTKALHFMKDFPPEYFIRKESIDIFRLLKCRTTQIVLVRSPGVGKSLLLVLYSFWKSFYKKKNAVLVRRIQGEGGGLFVFLLQGQNHPSDDNNKDNNKEIDVQKASQYAAEALTLPTLLGPSDFSQTQPNITNTKRKLQKWSVGTLENVPDLLFSIGQRIGDYELCFDGINKKELRPGRLEAFSVLATSAHFQVKSADTPVLELCLVPFWSVSDLKTVGKHNRWDEHECEQVYYYSGGNLRSFLLGEKKAKSKMDHAFQYLDIEIAKLLIQDGSILIHPIDRIRTVTLRTDNLDNYSSCSKWSYVISSLYALRKIGGYVTIEYYKGLCTTANAINDYGLFKIAFENYIHTMARNKSRIPLRIRKYDREKLDIHKYKSLTVDCRKADYLLAGETEDECKQILASKLGSVGYWHPCSRSLKTLDCVAKLTYKRKKLCGLLQITKSKRHNIDVNYLAEISANLSPKIYIVVVPNKEISDQFRLSPAEPVTPIPLYVAYLQDSFFEVFTDMEDDRN